MSHEVYGQVLKPCCQPEILWWPHQGGKSPVNGYCNTDCYKRAAFQHLETHRLLDKLLRSSSPLRFAYIQNYRPSLRENIIVSDSHRPFCTPTKHILATRNQETKTFPKSTYASGDAGIPGESQKESTPVRIKSGFSPGYGKATRKKSKKTWR
jgi:hypothetical protein